MPLSKRRSLPSLKIAPFSPLEVGINVALNQCVSYIETPKTFFSKSKSLIISPPPTPFSPSNLNVKSRFTFSPKQEAQNHELSRSSTGNSSECCNFSSSSTKSPRNSNKENAPVGKSGILSPVRNFLRRHSKPGHQRSYLKESSKNSQSLNSVSDSSATSTESNHSRSNFNEGRNSSSTGSSVPSPIIQCKVNEHTGFNQNETLTISNCSSTSVSTCRSRQRFTQIDITSNELLQNGKFMKIVRKAGSGYAGTVYKCVLTAEKYKNQQVAVKVMNKETTKQKNADKELVLLKMGQGPNVIRLISGCETLDAYVILTEFCSHGDLHGLLTFLDNLDVIARLYLRQVADGLKWLHDRLIAHCDVKMKNIVITDHNVAKLADLGFASRFPCQDSLTDVCVGTRDYWAPEMLVNSPNFSAFIADFYALGVTFVGVCERRPIKKKHDDIYKIVRAYKDAPREVFEGLLQIQPELRWTAENVGASSWITEVMTPPASPV